MKNSLLFFLLYALLNLLSRHNSLFAQNLSDSSYFTLSLGSQWTFTSGYSLHTERLADTSNRQGKLYYGLALYLPDPYFWFRDSHDSIYVVYTGSIYSEGKESLLYNFNGNIGDTILLPSYYRGWFGLGIILFGKHDTVITPAGTYTNCFHFLHLGACCDAGIVESWFARGVGRIKYSEENIGGLITHTLSSYNITTGVIHPRANENASSYILFNAYPNPFNPQTTLNFQINEMGIVTITIYNLLGKQIACLLNEQRQPGDYRVNWNAKGFSSGVYYAVLRLNNLEETRKLILLK